MTRRITRRTVLRGLGTTVALPLLEAMTPATLFGKAPEPASPLRMAFLVTPNGMHMPDWTPEDEGPLRRLPWILEPLEPFKRDLLVLSGLAQRNAHALGDGGGDHARSAATFLTGVHPRKTNGANIQAGISADQIAAQKIGHETRLPSLELGCDKGMYSGSCDSGYSCAYQSNISWRTESTPMSKEHNPRLAFERLFGGGSGAESAESQARRRLFQQSVLDFVRHDAQQLQKKLGAADNRKLDEYFTGVRELELRLKAAEKHAAEQLPDYQKPDGVPKDYQAHIRLMCDLIVLAFQGNLTRITTFLVANEGSNRPYPFIDVSEGHHELSHHGGNKDKHAKIRKINRFHVEQLAYLLDKLRAVREGDRTLLDNSMIVFGSGISDGDRHNHNELPIVLAGSGGGTFSTGRHVRYAKDTPLNNLFLSMLERMGAPTERFGDSTGKLPQLST